MKTFANLFAAVAILTGFVGCEYTFFPLTKEEVIARERSLPGEICHTAGHDYGPFKVGPDVAVEEVAGGTFALHRRPAADFVFECPQAPDHTFHASSYISEGQEVFYVLRKIPVSRETAKPTDG